MKIVIANSNPVHDHLFDKKGTDHETHFVRKKDELTFDFLCEFDPDYVFFPHWSYIIPEKIWSRFNCVVFHMTDLPYGRGGSPLQNLIVRGHEKTVISALKVNGGIDEGDVYLKKELILAGRAEEIFLKAGVIIVEMIDKIIEQKIIPEPQEGKPTLFKRRKPEESDMENLSSLDEVFNYIRMLDADGYPHAYIESEHFKFEFTRASKKADQSIIADVRITKK